MAVSWQLYRFDYARYREIRPALRVARSPENFAALADQQETDAIVEALVEGKVGIVEAKQAFIIALCCIGEPLVCPPSILRLLHARMRDIRTEAGIELLVDALAGAKNLEAAMVPHGKTFGCLTPSETAITLQAYRIANTRRSVRSRNEMRPVRRGGLFGLVGTFFRRLFDRGLAAQEVYQLLGDLLEEANGQGQGIAVIAV